MRYEAIRVGIGLLSVSMTLSAGTIASATVGFDAGGCDSSDPSAAICSGSGPGGASATASATSSFGAVAGSLSVGSGGGYATAAYKSAFSDYVVVSGGTGPGSLTVLFAMQTAVSGEVFEFSHLVNSYEFIVGSVDQSGDLSPGTTISATSPFTFGMPTRLGAAVAGFTSTMGTSLTLTADFRVTDVRVFDAAAKLVPDALVVAQGSNEEFFPGEPLHGVPEPNTWIPVVSAAAVLAFLALRRSLVHREPRRSDDRDDGLDR